MTKYDRDMNEPFNQDTVTQSLQEQTPIQEDDIGSVGSIEQTLYEWNGYGAYIVLTAKDYERVVAKLTELELLESVLGKDMVVLPCFLDVPDYDALLRRA